MEKSDFILLIPGIIYGVALVDLLKIFRHKNTYWEVTGWGIAMIINLIVSWFNLYDKLEVISNSIVIFTFYLVSPLVFAQAVFVLTPEEDHHDTKKYFLETNRSFFGLMLIYILTTAVLSVFFNEPTAYHVMRGIIILPFVAIIIWQKKWLRQFALGLYYLFAIYIYLQGI
jgi:hypothetical protein